MYKMNYNNQPVNHNLMTTEENYLNSDSSQRKLYDSQNYQNIKQTHNSSFNHLEKIKLDFDFDHRLENQRPQTDRQITNNKNNFKTLSPQMKKKNKLVVPPLKIVQVKDNEYVNSNMKSKYGYSPESNQVDNSNTQRNSGEMYRISNQIRQILKLKKINKKNK
jgi:hypothetical protein